jgi:HMGL-like
MLNLSILPVLSKNCSNWLPLWNEVRIKIHPVRYLRTVTVSVKGKQSTYRSWLLCHHDGNPQPPQYMFSTTTTSPAKNKVDVQIVEVGPRDGLQNEKITITTKDKVTLIEMLVEAGCTKIEAGSFVNPLIVPKMANSMDVIQSLSNVRTNAGSSLRISALVPTAKYLQSALTAKVDEIAIFASASEAFSQKVRFANECSNSFC